ncbi:MAG: M48 family metalloprotease [Fimbriimonas ginsengisoli]|uniref:M48 family metalloprotease n=1 Tax=Fimbriimonas ginsengisoli TaxID=1005039 RepID=A0A931LTF5_FIMGI|nr:M48 family metalloprotease [Fimbriimonas ginsengisoli]
MNGWDHPWVKPVGWALVHSLWEGVAIAVLAGLVAFALRRARPEARYAVWCFALALIAIAPIATLLIVARHALPDLEARHSLALTLNAGALSVHPATVGPLGAFLRSVEPALPWMVMAWLIGSGLMGVRAIGGLLRVEWLRHRRATPADEALQGRARALAACLGLRRRFELMLSAAIHVPSAMGAFKPVVLIPASLVTRLSMAELDAVLAHELAHIRRHDYLVNLIQSVVETVMFYHPAIWWVTHQIRIERENCCDDLAIQATGDRIAYARALANLEESRIGTPRLALAITGGSLMQRIRRILGRPHLDRLSLSWLPAIAVLGIALPFGAEGWGGAKPVKRPEVKIESRPAEDDTQRGFQQCFQQILDDPEAEITIDGKHRKVKDLTPAERKQIKEKLDRAAKAVEASMKIAGETVQKTLSEVFRDGGPVQKAIETATESLSFLGKGDGQQFVDVRREIREAMKAGREEMRDAMREAREAIRGARESRELRRQLPDPKSFNFDFDLKDLPSEKDFANIPREIEKAMKELERELPNMQRDLHGVPSMQDREQMRKEIRRAMEELRKELAQLKDLKLPAPPKTPVAPKAPEVPKAPEAPAAPSAPSTLEGVRS